jgi:23S rRNA pseudouridine2604 synthase
MADPQGPEPIRLAKRVAAQLSCSRSDAENFIAGGWVRVNGHVQESPQSRVEERDVVEVDPKARLEALAPVTVLWHKPAGVAMPEGGLVPPAWAAQHLGASTRWSGDRSGVRLLKAHAQQLQVGAGLAVRASGLVVLSQNPGVVRKLSDASDAVEHEWLAEVAQDPALQDPDRREAVLQSLGKVVFVDGTSVPKARASWQSEWRLRLAIKGYLDGQVAHLAERAGLSLTGLRRLRVGRLSLTPLPEGQWRFLLLHERF